MTNKKCPPNRGANLRMTNPVYRDPLSVANSPADGDVLIDLAATEPDSRRHTLAALVSLPAGATVTITVGALPVDPQLVWLIGDHTAALQVRIRGDVAVVGHWLAALGHGPRYSALTL